MKFNYRIFSAAIAILFFVLMNKSFSQNTISGTVYYSDNNQVVTSGVVKAYDLNGVFVEQTNINSNGTYSLTGLSGINYDIIGVPSIGEEDFPPTGFPNVLDPSQMVSILGLGTIINKDIYVQRIVRPLSPQAGFINGIVSGNAKDIDGAVIYAIINDKVIGYSTTDSKGNYSITGLPLGDYILVIHRIGDKSSSKSVELSTKGVENINFKLEPLKNTVKNTEINPVAFQLNQNYPNPFNPSTLISYSISKDTHVRISIYNTLGEEVSSLINNDQKAGAYSVRFDGAGLSSGIYFYTLETSSGFADTKRMVLIK